MENLKGHWKKNYDFRYLAGEDIIKDVTLTIKAVIKDEVESARGKEEVTALHFEETVKLMALNKTNSRTISKVVGSPMVESWIGKKIILTQKNVTAFGGEHQVIRVKLKKVI